MARTWDQARSSIETERSWECRGAEEVRRTGGVGRPTNRDLATKGQRERRGGWKIEEGSEAGQITESSGRTGVDLASSIPGKSPTHAQGSANTEIRGMAVEEGEGADFPEH